MESEYFRSGASERHARHAGKTLETFEDAEAERNKFLALLDKVNNTPAFIEMCEKSQRLTPYQMLMLEGLESDYQAHGELR